MPLPSRVGKTMTLSDSANRPATRPLFAQSASARGVERAAELRPWRWPSAAASHYAYVRRDGALGLGLANPGFLVPKACARHGALRDQCR